MNQGHRVLIIDPFDEGEMYALALRARDIVVTVAESACDGRVCYEQQRADIVVVGPRLLDASQVDVVHWLKAQTPAPSVVVLAAHAYEPWLARLRNAGPDAIQLPPCLPHDFVDLLRGLYGVGDRPAEVSAPAARRPPTPQFVSSGDGVGSRLE
jgi:DNA-binding NarL/FixJ family response regulator